MKVHIEAMRKGYKYKFALKKYPEIAVPIPLKIFTDKLMNAKAFPLSSLRTRLIRKLSQIGP